MIHYLTDEVVSLLDQTPLCPQETREAKKLQEKLQSDTIIVSVVGQFKRGKSSIINALLEQDLLPVGIVPITSAITYIYPGDQRYQVRFENGLVKEITKDQLEEHLCVEHDQDGTRGVASLHLQTPNPFLEQGFVLVDTPGVGSYHTHNTETAYSFTEKSDGVIFTLSVDSPINEIEMDFLRQAKAYAGKFYFVVNKVDTINEHQLEEYLTYCEDLLKKLLETDQVRIFPVSALKGHGIQAFSSFLTQDIQSKKKEIIEHSVHRKLSELVASSLSQITLYRKAFNLPIGILGRRLKQMEQTIAATRGKSEEVLNTFTQKEEEMTRFFDQGLWDSFSTELCVSMIDEQWSQLFDSMQLTLNEMKKNLGDQVTQLFEMDYPYALTLLEEGHTAKAFQKQLACVLEEGSEENKTQRLTDYLHCNIQGLWDYFHRESTHLCDQLSSTLDEIFLYKEKNSIKIAYQMESLYKLVRRLKRVQHLLNQPQEKE